MFIDVATQISSLALAKKKKKKPDYSTLISLTSHTLSRERRGLFMLQPSSSHRGRQLLNIRLGNKM